MYLQKEVHLLRSLMSKWPIYICNKRRFKSACAYAQTDQGACAHRYIFYKNYSVRESNTLFRLCGCTGLSEHSLSVYVMRTLFHMTQSVYKHFVSGIERPNWPVALTFTLIFIGIYPLCPLCIAVSNSAFHVKQLVGHLNSSTCLRNKYIFIDIVIKRSKRQASLVGYTNN